MILSSIEATIITLLFWNAWSAGCGVVFINLSCSQNSFYVLRASFSYWQSLIEKQRGPENTEGADTNALTTHHSKIGKFQYGAEGYCW